LTINRKIPKQKLLLGVPFYGKEFNATELYMPQTGNVTDMIYTNVAPRLSSSSWEYYWDDFSKVPYLLNTAHTKFVTFDDTTSIRIKCEYALTNQLSGIMIWALGQDLMGASQPLLETIGREMGLVTSIDFLEEVSSSDFYLYDNYPNPFNPITTLSFVIGHSSLVVLKVYNVLGDEVATIVNENLLAGNYKYQWNANGISSGVYFYTLMSSNFKATKKLILMK